MFSEGFELADCQLHARVEVQGLASVIDNNSLQLPPGAAGQEVTLHLRAVRPIHHASLPTLVQHPAHAATAGGARCVRSASGATDTLPVIRVKNKHRAPVASGPP